MMARGAVNLTNHLKIKTCMYRGVSHQPQIIFSNDTANAKHAVTQHLLFNM